MIYEALKDFQSGIVGILGFAGVILTLWWNAHLAEVARTEQINQSRLTLETALRRELISIREELTNLKDEFGGKAKGPVEFTLEEAYVYRTLVKDIGVLHQEQAQTIIRVHRDLYLVMHLVRGLATDSSKPVATMEPKDFVQAEKMIASVLGETDEAIQALAD